MSKNLIILSRYFAPSPTVGAKRFTFLCREFESLGLDVYVVSGPLTMGEAPDESLPSAAHVIQRRPLVEVPLRGSDFASKTVSRLAARLLTPVVADPFWIAPAANTGARLARELQRGIIIATVPPAAAALAALRIARSSGWPVVLDYRDPWSGYPWVHKLTGRCSRRLAARLEGRCVAASAARVFNTPEMRAAFEHYFPRAPSDRHFVIPNGFDETPESACIARTTARTIVHAGAIYGDRSLVPVLRAIATLQSRRPELAPQKLVIYGDIAAADQALIRAQGLQHLIDIRARVARDKLVVELRAAAALLVVSGDQMGYSVPYKVYDYMNARRPILAISKASSALARIVREHDLGEHALPDSQETVTAALERVLAPTRELPDRRALERFRWSTLAREYLGVLAQLGWV